jgi:hypothetical protein
MRSVPFSLPSLYAGFGEGHGVLFDEQEALRFEFQVKDKLGGWLKGKVKNVRVPVNQIVSVQLTKGWLGSTWLGVKIIIQASGLEVLRDIPGASQGKLELSVARNDVAAAEAFVDGLYTDPEVVQPAP